MRWINFVVLVLAACSSSSSPRHATDGGRRDGGSKSCNPLGASVCSRGQTCCFSDGAGTCTDLHACTSTISVECTTPNRCKSGEVCCATLIPPPRSETPTPLLDGSVRMTGSGADVTVKSSCVKSCDAPSFPLCRTSADCEGGAICTTLPEGANAGLIAVAVETFLVCAPADGSAPSAAQLPLLQISDVALPGGATRFDYQDVDTNLDHLVIAHMNDGAVVVVKLSDGSVLKELTSIPVARGVIVADDVGTIFVTSSPNQLVLIDNKSLTEIQRVTTGAGPDGVGWDPLDKVVGVSDQADGALSLITDAGKGKRTQVGLGTETGNVVFDATRGWFWITVVAARPPDQLVAVDPTTAQTKTTIDLPGCSGAHGLRLHPDAKSAFIACETNNALARVELDGAHAVTTAPTGSGPDVLAIDPGLGWLYVAAESGDLTVFDISQPGVKLIGHDHPGSNAHTIAVDPATHRVFFPLMAGPDGTPMLRIMRPTGL